MMKKLLVLAMILNGLTWCAPAHAALNCAIQTGNHKLCSSATTCAQAYGTNPTAGNLLFVHADINTNIALTISSTLEGSTWHEAQVATSPVTNSTVLEGKLWWVVAAGGGADTVTIANGNVANNIEMSIGECNGFTGTKTEDQGKNSTGNSTTASTGTTSATTQANEVVVGALFTNAGGLAVPAGYTLFGTTDAFSVMFWKIVAATGTQVATHATTTGTWAGQIDTFYDAASTGGKQVGAFLVGP